MIWMIKKIYIYVISMILLNGLVGSISYLCFRKIRQQLERKGLISMCITVLRGAILSFLMPIVIVLIYFIYYVYEEDYTMFALSPLVGWVFFVVGIIWMIGFLKAIVKTIRIQTQMNQLRKRACVCSRSILDCKNQWKEEVVVRRNVEIKTVYGLAVPIICGFLKPMILLPEREYNKEELKIICIHELIHCKHKDILWKQLCGLVRVIHWWNPLVKQLDMDVDSWNETYCDLESTTIMKSKKRYFTTICEIGISPFAKGAYLCAALGEDKSQLKTRILRIKSIENKNTRNVMAGTFLCIGLSFVVVAVIILSTIGYHKIYVETVWATEIEEDLPEEETEYTMDLKEYTAKRIGTNLAVTKLKQNIKKGEEIDVVQPLNAKTRLETKELELKKGEKIDLTVFSSQEIQREDKDFVAGIIDGTGKERYVMHAVDIIHDFYVKKDGKYKVFVENRYKKKIKIGIAICVEE